METDDYYDSAAYADDDQDASPPMDDVEEERDAQETLNECLSKFGTADFIMEPEIFSQLKKYFQVSMLKTFFSINRCSGKINLSAYRSLV